MKIKFFYSPITGASAPILSKLTLALLFHLRWVDTLLNTMFTLRDLKEGRCKRSYKNVVAYQCSFTFQLPDDYTITARLAESFYNVKNGSSIITSKSSSKNLSNEKKQWCFCCLQDKTWIKIPILWKHFSITEILWRTFWCNIWRSIFGVVKILRKRDPTFFISTYYVPKWSVDPTKIGHGIFLEKK